MRFAASAAVLAFASFVSAALDPTADFDSVTTPASGQTIDAGKTFEVDWTTIEKYNGVTISISLIGGPNQAGLQPISTIATGIKNSALKYEWAVDPSLGTKALYGLVFTNEQDTTIFQYSNPFHIAASASSGNASSTTTITTSVGTMTVSLSEAPSTTSSVTQSNLSTTTTSPGKTTITTRVGASSTSSSPTTASTGAGAQATVGSMLGLAGFALAALAL